MQAFLISNFLVVNAPTRTWQRGFQIPASPIAEGIRNFHHDLRLFLTGICFFVVYILASCLSRFAKVTAEQPAARLTHASTIEIIWTIIPALILIVIAIPSFSLLYSMDETIEPLFTVKVIGHQWYWSYEFLDPEVVSTLYNDSLAASERSLEVKGSGTFDSYRLSDDELLAGEGLTAYRLLTVDNHLFLPTERHIHARVTSADVLHSWAIPALGVKIDACPGRLNQTSIFIKREGIYYGQCSEICGVNHGFRPIGIVSLDLFGGVNTGAAIDFEPVLSFLQASINALYSIFCSNLLYFFEEVTERSKVEDCKSFGFSLRWFKSNSLHFNFIYLSSIRFILIYQMVFFFNGVSLFLFSFQLFTSFISGSSFIKSLLNFNAGSLFFADVNFLIYGVVNTAFWIFVYFLFLTYLVFSGLWFRNYLFPKEYKFALFIGSILIVCSTWGVFWRNKNASLFYPYVTNGVNWEFSIFYCNYIGNIKDLVIIDLFLFIILLVYLLFSVSDSFSETKKLFVFRSLIRLYILFFVVNFFFGGYLNYSLSRLGWNWVSIELVILFITMLRSFYAYNVKLKLN